MPLTHSDLFLYTLTLHANFYATDIFLFWAYSIPLVFFSLVFFSVILGGTEKHQWHEMG